jgi:hypothetical protein
VASYQVLPTRLRKENIVFDQHENILKMAARNRFYIPNFEEFLNDFLQLIQIDYYSSSVISVLPPAATTHSKLRVVRGS